MAQIEAYPVYASEEEKDLWLQRVATSINELSSTGITGTGGTGDGNVELDEDSGRITSRPPGATDPIFLGYAYRYLHVRLSSTEDGTALIPDISMFAGPRLYIGLFNSQSNTSVPADANFIYSEFSWAAGNEVSFRITGGRNILFTTGASTPTGNTQITTSTEIIDLEASIAGTQGPMGDDGLDSIDIRIVATGGTVFKSDVTEMKTITANVSLGGALQDNATHSTYNYDWQFNGNTVYVDSVTRDVLTTNGVPIVDGDTPPGGNAVLARGDGLGTINRNIRVSEDDINNGATLFLSVDVSNIQ